MLEQKGVIIGPSVKDRELETKFLQRLIRLEASWVYVCNHRDLASGIRHFFAVNPHGCETASDWGDNIFAHLLP